jgi:hypothetical protein
MRAQPDILSPVGEEVCNPWTQEGVNRQMGQFAVEEVGDDGVKGKAVTHKQESCLGVPIVQML